VTTKINLQYVDGTELLRTLSNSTMLKPREQIHGAKTLDDLNIVPGMFARAAGSWYMPISTPPIYGGGGPGTPGLGRSSTAGYQVPFGGAGGFGGGGLGGGGFGGGGLGGGFPGGGIGGGGGLGGIGGGLGGIG